MNSATTDYTNIRPAELATVRGRFSTGEFPQLIKTIGLDGKARKATTAHSAVTTSAADIEGDKIEATSWVREARSSIHQGLDMLRYVPSGAAGRTEIEQAQDLMLRAQARLKAALCKINNPPSNRAAQRAA